jgi:hypothetical protein
MASRDLSAAGLSAGSARPNGRADVLGVKSGFQPHYAADFEVAAKETANEFGLVFDDMERAVFDPVAERNRRRPDALPL